MTDGNKENRCICCLGLGIIVLILGVLWGIIGSEGFGMPHILAIVVGGILILVGVKKTKLCKCGKK